MGVHDHGTRKALRRSFAIATAIAASAAACSLFDPILGTTDAAQSLMREPSDASTDGVPSATPSVESDASKLDSAASDAGEADTSCANPIVFTFDFTTYPPPGFDQLLHGGGSLAHVEDDGYETDGGALVAKLVVIPYDYAGAYLERFIETPGRSFKLTFGVKLTPTASGMTVYPGCGANTAGQLIGLRQEKNILYLRGASEDGGRAADITETKWHSVSIRAGITKSYEGYLYAEVDGLPVMNPPRFEPGPGADASFNGVDLYCGGSANADIDASTNVLVDDVRLEICP